MGSGRGEKRKAEAELSRNPNTIKARQRIISMNVVAQEIERAKNAERSAISKALKKEKTSDFYQSLPLQKQQEHLKEVRERVLKQRYVIIFALIKYTNLL